MDKSLLSTPLSYIESKNPLKNSEFWKPIVNKMISYYDKILIKKSGKIYLPKNTLLYHGDLGYPFVPGSKSTGDKTKMTFFGLDIEIAIWYISELIDLYLEADGSPIIHKYGFLYAFVLNKDLEINAVLDGLFEHPKEVDVCNNKTNVCLHPQISYRGDLEYCPDIYKLSSELTFFFEEYKDVIDLKRVYIIDPMILHKNKENKDFKSRNSIIKRYNKIPEELNDEYLERISVEYFRDLYFGAIKKKKKKKTKKKEKKSKKI
jgi:hypothetical protein